jgi:photosystem II stability/assembly factor-like uncharacterized protein
MRRRTTGIGCHPEDSDFPIGSVLNFRAAIVAPPSRRLSGGRPARRPKGGKGAGATQVKPFSLKLGLCCPAHNSIPTARISETISEMRIFLIFLAATALAQSKPQTHPSNTTESLRGASAVSKNIAWASGTHGTYLRTTDAGRTWIPAQVPDAATVDFRAVVAFSADEAFLMSAGPGDQSRIYHTADAGKTWQRQFTNTNPKGFFDSMVFWDRTHGIVLGDPIPDEGGQLKFELLMTNDGESWTQIPPSQLPPAIEGEGAFAASNTSLAILTSSVIPSEARNLGVAGSTAAPASTSTFVIPSEARDLGVAGATNAAGAVAQPPAQPWKNDASAPLEWAEVVITMDPDIINEIPFPGSRDIWFATGGKAARVFHSPDRGQSWQVFNTPIIQGQDSTGIFSIAFRDALHGVIAGGDYKHPDQDGPNLAFTNDGGKTWTLSQIFPQAYYSAVAYDRRIRNPKSKDKDDDNQAHVRLFLVGPKFVYDFRPPKSPTRISPSKKSGIQFNAASPFPEGGTLAVGPKGSIAIIP